MIIMTMTTSCKFIYLGVDYDYYYDNGEILVALRCPYCRHVWQPKVPSPVACPKCKRYFTENKQAGEEDGYEPQQRIKGPVDASIPKTNHPNPKAYVQCYRGTRSGECGEKALIKLGKHSYCYEHGVQKMKELRDGVEDQELL